MKDEVSMEFRTVDHWVEEIWRKWRIGYDEAFGHTHAKPEKVIRNMFQKQTCYFHLALEGSEVCAIALSGQLSGTRMLLIDYFAVREKKRNRGIGQLMAGYLLVVGQWQRGQFDSLVIEVEAAEKTKENLVRIQFWKKCNFTLTEYIHHYKVVPEPYQAMYQKLFPEVKIPEREEAFFHYIGKFHQKSFQDV